MADFEGEFTVVNPKPVDPDENVFHGHLDDCDHCSRNPFDLCVVGQLALDAQFRGGAMDLRARHGGFGFNAPPAADEKDPRPGMRDINKLVREYRSRNPITPKPEEPWDFLGPELAPFMNMFMSLKGVKPSQGASHESANKTEDDDYYRGSDGEEQSNR